MLGVGSGTHGEQTARVIERLEPVLGRGAPRPRARPRRRQLDARRRARGGASSEIPLAHVEAGLRSFDRTMPEEINRVVADQLSDLLFLHSEEAAETCAARGSPDERDALRRQHDDRHAGRARGPVPRARGARSASGSSRARTCWSPCTGPALVDGPLLARRDDARSPRSRARCRSCSRSTRERAKMLDETGGEYRGVPLTDPLGYLDFLSLEADARRGARPTPAGSRRRRPSWASRASRCAPTPSGRSRCAPGRTPCSASTRRGSRRSRAARRARRGGRPRPAAAVGRPGRRARSPTQLVGTGGGPVTDRAGTSCGTPPLVLKRGARPWGRERAARALTREESRERS